MIDINDIKKILNRNKKELNKKYNVTEIGIFGSYINNTQSETSDIDILVEFEKAIDLIAFVNLKNHLSSLFGKNVDLVMKKALKPKISERILKEVIIL